MRLHGGGGSVVAYARRTLGGQAIGTEFCHRSCRGSHSLATRAHGIAMILSPPRGCLMPRLRPPAPLPHAALAAVDLPVVVERAEVDDEPAPRAGNPYEHLDIIHVRTETAALMKVAPPVRLRAPSPGQRPRATRRPRALHLGLHPFRRRRIAYAMSRAEATSRTTPRCAEFSGSPRSFTMRQLNRPCRRRWHMSA